MKIFVKNFTLRGLIAMGFGPIIYSIVMLILYLCNVDTLINGVAVFKAIISTSIMAFLIAGASYIWQVEKIGLAFQILIHGTFLYICYLITYLLNDWIINNTTAILIFTLVFVIGYLIIWLIIYVIEKLNARNLNNTLKNNLK